MCKCGCVGLMLLLHCPVLAGLARQTVSQGLHTLLQGGGGIFCQLLSGIQVFLDATFPIIRDNLGITFPMNMFFLRPIPIFNFSLPVSADTDTDCWIHVCPQIMKWYNECSGGLQHSL